MSSRMMGTATTTASLPLTVRRVQWVLAGMAFTVLAAVGVSAWAQPMPGPGGWGGPGMHRGMGGGMGPGMMMGSPERIGRVVDHLLDGLNASDAQRARIKQIATAAAADLRGQREAGRELRRRGAQLFTAPTVDAGAAEQLRQQMLQQHDQASRRMTQAMVEIANVLTPEQRAKVGERLRDRQARMEDRMRRMESRGGRPPPPPPSTPR